MWYRNNSARELSQYAESAMAVNRVVLQHFSMNLDYMVQERPNIYGPNAADVNSVSGKLDKLQVGGGGTTDDNDKYSSKVFGLSPPSESKLVQRRLKARSSCQYESNIVTANQSIPVASPSGWNNQPITAHLKQTAHARLCIVWRSTVNQSHDGSFQFEFSLSVILSYVCVFRLDVIHFVLMVEHHLIFITYYVSIMFFFVKFNNEIL